MANISKEVNIDMLEKLADGSYKKKNPSTKASVVKFTDGTTVESHKADYIHHAGYGAASGTNAKTIALNPAPTSYKEGMTVAFKNVTQNTGAVTINVNGLGAKTILKSSGKILSSGNLKKDSVYTVKYNGTNFILQGEGGEYGTALASDVLRPKTVGTENGIVTGTMVDRGTVNQTLTTQSGQYTIPGGKHSGSGKVTVNINNLVASNIKKGINVGGVMGSYVATLDDIELTPGSGTIEKARCKPVHSDSWEVIGKLTIRKKGEYRIVYEGYGGSSSFSSIIALHINGNSQGSKYLYVDNYFDRETFVLEKKLNVGDILELKGTWGSGQFEVNGELSVGVKEKFPLFAI